MLNRNYFFALAFGLLATTSVYADNPGEEDVTPVVEVAEVQQEEVVQETASSSSATSLILPSSVSVRYPYKLGYLSLLPDR